MLGKLELQSLSTQDSLHYHFLDDTMDDSRQRKSSESLPFLRGDGRCLDKRSEFLLEVYRQTSAHLGRHVSGVWQCVGVVGGAVAVFALDKDKDFNDYACALVIVLSGWLISTTLDASAWFNRNIAIIGNVERLFFEHADSRLVHHFFLKHRDPGSFAGHFKIQLALAVVVALLVLVYHFENRVAAGMHLPLSSVDFSRTLPWVAAVAVAMISGVHAYKAKKKDKEFQEQSPGYQWQPLP
jgi:hypothetical protein